MLVVDDEESILFAISDFFSLRGFIVDCAREVEEAWACLSGNHYGVVIADLRLTGIYGAEGLELVSYIREKSATTRVLLLTAYGSRDIQEEASRRGVDAFLQKPQPLSEVANVVDAILGR